MRALAFLLLLGCTYDHAYADARTARLREEFPIGHAARAEVHARWGKPVVSVQRPDIGWSREGVGALAVDAEARTGTFIARVEKLVVPDATSCCLTLGHIWYFYDRSDVVADVIYERMGD